MAINAFGATIADDLAAKLMTPENLSELLKSGTVRNAAENITFGRMWSVAEFDISNIFVFAGRIGTGFDTKQLLDLRAKLDAIEIPEPPFTKGTGLPRLGAHWTQPQIVVRVGFIEWTVNGKLRHPRLIGVRTDKKAREVVREK